MVTFNIFIIIFTITSVIYFSNIIFKNQNLASRYKFQISSLLFFLLTLLIGLKGTVGSDYGSYYLDFIYMSEYYMNNFDFKTQSLDLVYEFLSNLVVITGLSYNYLSLLIGAVLISSIIFFACKEKDYLLIILIFLSYHYLILGMGYIRQGLSISFIMFFIHFWRNQKIFLSLVFFILAVLSHKFAICTGFLLFIRPKGNWFYLNIYFYLILFFGLILILYKIFSVQDLTYYLDVYANEFSKGAYYRTLAFFITALLFFSKKSYFKKRHDYRYLYISANFLILLFPLTFIFTTIADRLTSYFLPFALIVIGNFSTTFNKLYSEKIKFFLVLILFTHLFLWTNLSDQAKYYVPFQMLDKPSDKINPYKYIDRRYYCC